VRAFGEKVFDIIETTPDRLREIDGIGPVRAASILPSRSCQRTPTGSRAIFGAPAAPFCGYARVGFLTGLAGLRREL
jgi:hypothetical protein